MSCESLNNDLEPGFTFIPSPRSMAELLWSQKIPAQPNFILITLSYGEYCCVIIILCVSSNDMIATIIEINFLNLSKSLHKNSRLDLVLENHRTEIYFVVQPLDSQLRHCSRLLFLASRFGDPVVHECIYRGVIHHPIVHLSNQSI